MINTLENFSKFNLTIIARGEKYMYEEYGLEDLHKINKTSIFEIYDKYKDDKFIIDIIKNMEMYTTLWYKDKNNKFETIDYDASNTITNNRTISDIVSSKYLTCYNYEDPLNFEQNLQNTAKFIKNIEIYSTTTVVSSKTDINIDYIRLLNNLLNVDIVRKYRLILNDHFVNSINDYYSSKKK